MTNPYRAMCAELVDALAEWRLGGGPPEDTADADLIDRARTLLAEAEAEGPTDEELDRMERKYWKLGSSIEIEPEGIREVWDREETFDHRAFARAVFARWGRPAAAPVPVSERLQQLEDLAADAVSGLRYIEQTHGRLYGVGWDRVYEKADRLQPAHALPLPTPEATND